MGKPEGQFMLEVLPLFTGSIRESNSCMISSLSLSVHLSATFMSSATVSIPFKYSRGHSSSSSMGGRLSFRPSIGT